MGLRMQAVIVNCHDPGRLAEFWAEALGWRITVRGDPEWGIEPPEGSREDSVVPDLLFIRVPDAKQGFNRLHLDLRPTATPTRPPRSPASRRSAPPASTSARATCSWVVMADPEGNEFCVLPAYSGPRSAVAVANAVRRLSTA